MKPTKLNPHIARLVCSKSGREVPTDGFRRPLGLCPCCPEPGKPLLVQYRLDAVTLNPASPALQRSGIWQYAPLLPVEEPYPGYATDVGLTPCIEYPELGRELNGEVWIKHEGPNPSGSFKDRGLSVAVALGAACGVERFCLPTQGNAGVAAALFCRRMGLSLPESLPPCAVYMPESYVDSPYHRAAAHFGADVTFHGENIAAAGRKMRDDLADELASRRMTDLSTFFEPGRLEGKKTMGLEIADQFPAGHLPDFIFYPTGGGTGLVGIWKAFDELIQLGRLDASQELPKMVAVQSERCAPVVQSFHAGHDEVQPVESQGTIADGLDVPAAIMGHEILRVLRESGGTAVSVPDEAIRRAFVRLGQCGVSCGYEGAATLAAMEKLRTDGTISSGARVLLLNTSGHGIALAAR